MTTAPAAFNRPSPNVSIYDLNLISVVVTMSISLTELLTEITVLMPSQKIVQIDPSIYHVDQFKVC